MAEKKSEHGLLCKVKNVFGARKNKKQEDERPDYDYEADHESDILRTFILSHREKSEEAKKFTDALVRAWETDLRTKEIIFSGMSDLEKADKNTNALLEYLKDMTGVLLLCSDELVKLLDSPETQETQVDIQVSGEDVHLDAKILSSGIEDSEIIKRKVVVVKVPDDSESMPKCLADKNALVLSKSNLDRSDPNRLLHEIWVRDNIIPKLKELVRKKLISQASWEEYSKTS